MSRLEKGKIKYIAFEGIPSAGKSSQFRRLQEFINKADVSSDIIFVFEPGGTEISDAIRRVVQEVKFLEEMNLWTETLLYAAARSQLLYTTVIPQLDNGGKVVSDRCFISSLTYQGIIRGFGIDAVWDLNKIVIENYLPDVILFYDIDVDTAFARRNDLWGDKFEREEKDFFFKLKDAYYEVSELDWIKDRWITIDGSGSKDDVWQRTLAVLKNLNFI